MIGNAFGVHRLTANGLQAIVRALCGCDHAFPCARGVQQITDAHAVPVHEETETRTAAQLGIPMPFPTAKPAFTALAMVVMFCGLLFMNVSFALAMAVLIGGAVAMVAGLYSWFTSPLE